MFAVAIDGPAGAGKSSVAKAAAKEPVSYTHLKEEGKLIEAQRIEQRTRYDMEMLQEIGFCKGIENYSRVLSGREPGSAPFTLIDYFPEDFVLFVDESHVTLPQVRGMYACLLYTSCPPLRLVPLAVSICCRPSGREEMNSQA